MPRRQNATIVPLRPGKRNGRTGEAIHLNIHNAIIGHRIPPGTALQEDALASAFDVSRTTIRKVLQRLSHERLVDLVPNKGASVAKPSAEEACEVFEARRAIERILVDRLVATGSDEGIATLVQTAKSEKAADESGNKPERVKLSGDFHRQLAKIAGNTILCGFLNELISRTSLIIALYESPGAVPCSHGEHLEIANALMRRDARKAVQYMEHHLQHVEAQIELSDSYQRIDFGKLFRGRT